MTTAAVPAIPTALRPPRTASAERLNGDWHLSDQQVREYVAHHAARNARNAALSRDESVVTLPAPAFLAPTDMPGTPSRAALNLFFDFAARQLAPRFAGRDITILDLGAGSGPCLVPFESAGYRGLYIGVDIKRNPRWTDAPTASFRKQLILSDCLALDVASLPPLDLIISSTALEHFEDDAEALARLATRLNPGGVHVHYVPAERSLPLYGPHGWRQYSPRCVRALFPTGTIYRTGGLASNALHHHAITRPTQHNRPTWMTARPRTYRALRNLALAADRALGNHPAAMYGVIQA